VGGWVARYQKTKTLVSILASFIVYLAVDLSIGSLFFPLIGDDASGHRALTPM
jgi:hypothetical protein